MDLAGQFEQETREAIRRCREFGYNPAYWMRMVADYGAVGAARRLLAGTRASDGFTRLWEEGSLDLSVEFGILLPKYRELFSEDERAEARRRLELYDFDVDAHLAEPSGTAPQEPDQPMPEGAAPDGPEAPVVAPVPTGGDGPGIWPTAAELARARQVFGTHERRDVFYRAATYLVDEALRGAAPVSVSEAIDVLLQTWNRAYYQYHPVQPDHFERIDALLGRHSSWLSQARTRTIDSFSASDGAALEPVFQDFENVLGPVGAAKALHLLAPTFLPLWDRAIAVAYGLQLGSTGTNGHRYVRMAMITKAQCGRLAGFDAVGLNVLTMLDEYNYCRFTKGWM